MSFPGYPDSFDPGWWRILVQVPPVNEPVTLANAKTFARILYSNEDTAVVTPLITAAREYVETAQARALQTQVLTIYFMGFPWTGGYYNRMIRSMGPNPWWLPTAQGIIQLPRPPLQMILSVGYINPQGLTQAYVQPSQYLYSNNSTPGRIQPVYGAVWPLSNPQIDAVQITYVAGYGSTSYGSAQTQTLAVQGFPTSGSFSLSWQGATTTDLTYTATSAQVQAALAALGPVGSGNVTCTGGPFPIAPIVVTWSGTLATGYQPQISATSSFTAALYPSSQPMVLTATAQLMPQSTCMAINQILADSFENREASMDISLKVTPAAERMIAVEQWGSYV